jgi:hypothetical protein
VNIQSYEKRSSNLDRTAKYFAARIYANVQPLTFITLTIEKVKGYWMFQTGFLPVVRAIDSCTTTLPMRDPLAF